MQIIFFIVVAIALIVFLIYTINKKFGKKEFFILLTIIASSFIIIAYMSKNIEQTVPDIFKENYEKKKNVQILKLSYERLNNKNISSSSNYIYNFDYIIKKDNQEFVCSAKKVKIKKIEDEFIFENFDKLNEKCVKK